MGTGRLPRVADENEELAAFADWSASYGSGALTLPAFFVAPAGDGPFPAVVFHHGSSGLLGASRGGAEALVAMGYAVLLAVRRGHNGAPGVFWETRVTAPWGSPQMGPQLVEALEDECDDALAALAWVKEQPMVDAARVAMIGSSYGGVMVMLAARRRAAFRAGISFAGPSITWPDAGRCTRYASTERSARTQEMATASSSRPSTCGDPTSIASSPAGPAEHPGRCAHPSRPRVWPARQRGRR